MYVDVLDISVGRSKSWGGRTNVRQSKCDCHTTRKNKRKEWLRL